MPRNSASFRSPGGRCGAACRSVMMVTAWVCWRIQAGAVVGYWQADGQERQWIVNRGMAMSFSSELRALMSARGVSGKTLAREVPCDAALISRYASGKQQPSPKMAARLDALLGADGRLAALCENASRRDALKLGMVASVAPEALGLVLDGAVAEAMEFTRLAGVTAVGRGVLDHLGTAIAGISDAYCSRPPNEVFPVARAYRARVAELTAGPCTLRETAALYVAAAWLSELLAWLAHDLGHPAAAAAYAIDSYEHAGQAGHDEICAWAADAMSSVALWSGQPARAAETAGRGIAIAPAGHPLAIRLRAQAARAHARLGQKAECERRLREAADLYERLPARAPMRFGTDTGTLASYAVTAYPASCYAWLGDYRRAETHGRAALAAHEAAPVGSRSPTREAIARIELAIAVTGLGEPDEGVALGLAALNSVRVVESVRSRAGDLNAALTARYPSHAGVGSFREVYRASTIATGPRGTDD
jgi:transcriptional regulator with XRE-family HTH domain